MVPTQKVTAGVLAGAIVTIIVWILKATSTVDTPAEVAAALVVIVSFLLGYVVRETRPTAPLE
jgi:hypothetical protein